MKRIAAILLFSCACFLSQAQENFITTVAGNGTSVYSGDGGQATNASFVYPECICSDHFGNIYVADVLGNRIRKIVLSTGIITTVAGNGTCGTLGDGGPATDAILCNVQGICSDTSGDIYFGDGDNSHPRIRKVTSSTGIITTIAGNGIYGHRGDGGPATDAEFEYPTGLLMDKNGELYVADIGSNTVRKISLTGIITNIAGNGTAAYSGDNGPAISAGLNEPCEVGLDSYGNIIITDYLNNCLRKVDATTNVITTICGNGLPGYTGDGGPASNAKLNEPYGIYVDKNDNIIFSDCNNAAIREIESSTGIINTVAGCGAAGFSGDGGPAIDADIQPADVCLDSFGNMYIADFLNYRIRKVYNPVLAVKSPRGSLKEIDAFPNPAHNLLFIENAKDNDITVFNVIGQEVYKGVISSNTETIDISGFANGMYVIRFVDAEMGQVAKKIIKE